MTKVEIENELKGRGNFVQIDSLGRFLKEPIALETKKFVFLKLAELYEKAKMFNEGAKMYGSAGDLSLAFAEKVKHYLKETELYVKAGSFDRVENAMRKAINEGNAKDKENIQISVKMFFKEQAQLHEKELKRSNALKYYEKMLEMKLSDQERLEVREKILDLYKKLGKITESRALERSLN